MVSNGGANVNLAIRPERMIEYAERIKSTQPEKAKEIIQFANKILKCECGCNKTFTKYETKQMHIRDMIRSSQTFKCNLCNKQFKLARGLLDHKAVPQNDKTKCKICGVICSTKGTLTKHIKKIHGAKKLICKICKETYSSDFQLNGHCDRI